MADRRREVVRRRRGVRGACLHRAPEHERDVDVVLVLRTVHRAAARVVRAHDTPAGDHEGVPRAVAVEVVSHEAGGGRLWPRGLLRNEEDVLDLLVPDLPDELREDAVHVRRGHGRPGGAARPRDGLVRERGAAIEEVPAVHGADDLRGTVEAQRVREEAVQALAVVVAVSYTHLTLPTIYSV